MPFLKKRSSERASTRKRERSDARGFGPHGSRRKTCRFCRDESSMMEYKDTERLWKFLTEKGKIVPRRVSGNCARHQREIARLIKRSRHAALLPFAAE